MLFTAVDYFHEENVRAVEHCRFSLDVITFIISININICLTIEFHVFNSPEVSGRLHSTFDFI